MRINSLKNDHGQKLVGKTDLSLTFNPTFTVQFIYMYIYIYIFILLRLNPFGLRVDREDGGLSTLCHSYGFACQQRVQKMFPGPGYLCAEDWVV